MAIAATSFDLPKGLAFLAGAIAAQSAAAVAIASGEPWLPFAVGGGAAAFATAALAPRTALLVLGAGWAAAHSVLADYSLGQAGIDVTLSRALGAIVVVGLGTALVLGRRPEEPRLPVPLWILGVFLALYTVAALTGPTRAEGVADLVRVASGIVIAWAAYRFFDTRERLLTLCRAVVAGGALVAAVTLCQVALMTMSPALAEQVFGADFFAQSYDEVLGDAAIRVKGPLGGAGETASLLVFVSAFALLRFTLLRGERRSNRQLYVVGVIALAVGATLTRASILALAVLVGAWALQHQLRRVSATSLRLRLVVATAVLAALAASLVGPGTLEARIWDLDPRTSGGDFAQGRGQIWSAEIELLRSSEPLRLLAGNGAHSSYLSDALAPVDTPQSPHNLILWLAVETGALGLAAFLVFLVSAARMFRRAAVARRYEFEGQVGALALAAIAAYAVQSMFILSPNSPSSGWYFMLLVGVALRVCSLREYRSGPVS